MNRPTFTHAQRAAVPDPRGPAYEVRAVWVVGRYQVVSQPVRDFDVKPLREELPDLFQVYTIGGAHVLDTAELSRPAAEKHASQLNGAP